MQTPQLQVRKTNGLLAEGLLFGLWVGDLLVSTEYWLLRGGSFGLWALRALFTRPLRLAALSCGALAAGSLALSVGAQTGSKARCAMLDEQAIVSAAELYKIETGRWPARQEDLFPRYLGVLRKDPWYRNYSLYRGDGGFAVVSAGPDGENGTNDDLIVIAPSRQQ
jgi:hypothetical protein